MKNKLISLTITLVLIISQCIPISAENQSSADLSYQYEVLKALHIIADETADDYNAFRDISKSSFINFLMNLCADYGYTIQYDENAINLAEGMGIIHKNQTDLYKPLSYDEAMTMVVRLMGYEIHAENCGGFPHGYTSISNRLGLNEGLQARSGQILQEYDAIKLLYNAARCAYVEVLGYTNDEVVYGGFSNKTVLYEFRKIYHITGVLQCTGDMALTSDVIRNPGSVMIGGYTYETEEDFSEYLGMNVEAYVRETDSDDEVLFVSPFMNKEITVDAEDIVGASNNYKKFEYYTENGQKKTLDISAIAAVLYNGQPVDKYNKDMFKPSQGDIRFIENDSSKSGYDAVIITDYKTVVVENILKSTTSLKNIYTYDTNNKTLNLKSESDDKICIFKDGKEVTFKDIHAGSVLTVAQSVVGGRKVIAAHMSDKQITGVVSQLEQKNDIFVTINDVEYVLSEGYEAAIKNKDSMAITPVIGNEYCFYLDVNGEIAFAKEIAGTSRYGIIMATAAEGVFASSCQVRLFTTEGEWKDYTFADKIQFTDEYGVTTRTKPMDILARLDKAADGNLSVIKYSTNSSGYINKLEKPSAYKGIDDEAFNYKRGITNRWRPNNQSFQSEIFVDTDAVLWFVRRSEDSAEDLKLLRDEESYSAHSVGSLAIDRIYTFDAYSVDRFDFADLFIVEESASLVAGSMDEFDAFIVDETGESLGEDGEILSFISGVYGRYDSVTYYSKEDGIFDGLRRGDVITLHTTSKGYVDGIAPIYERKNGIQYECPTKDSIHAVATKLHGVVLINNTSNNRMKVDCGTGTWNMRTAADNLVVIYDSEINTLRRGSVAEIEAGDFIVARMNRSATRAIVVYR